MVSFMSVITGHFCFFSSRGNPCGVEMIPPMGPLPKEPKAPPVVSNGDTVGAGAGFGAGKLLNGLPVVKRSLVDIVGVERKLFGAGAGVVVNASKAVAVVGVENASRPVENALGVCCCVLKAPIFKSFEKESKPAVRLGAGVGVLKLRSRPGLGDMKSFPKLFHIVCVLEYPRPFLGLVS